MNAPGQENQGSRGERYEVAQIHKHVSCDMEVICACGISFYKPACSSNRSDAAHANVLEFRVVHKR